MLEPSPGDDSIHKEASRKKKLQQQSPAPAFTPPPCKICPWLQFLNVNHCYAGHLPCPPIRHIPICRSLRTWMPMNWRRSIWSIQTTHLERTHCPHMRKFYHLSWSSSVQPCCVTPGSVSRRHVWRLQGWYGRPEPWRNNGDGICCDFTLAPRAGWVDWLEKSPEPSTSENENMALRLVRFYKDREDGNFIIGTTGIVHVTCQVGDWSLRSRKSK